MLTFGAVDARERRIVAEQRPSAELAFRSERFSAEVVELYDAASTDTRWLRYRVDYPVPKSKVEKRAHKATGETTPLSVAIPNRFRPGTIAAGLPFPMQLEMPVCLNAQFDPDTSRAGIRQRSWNEWLFARLAEAHMPDLHRTLAYVETKRPDLAAAFG